jgi:hypothetical protein
VAGLAVSGGVDIFTAGEHETRHRIENRSCGEIARERRYYHWYEPCTFKGSHVSGGQPNTTCIAVLADTRGYSNGAGPIRLARGRHE